MIVRHRWYDNILVLLIGFFLIVALDGIMCRFFDAILEVL